MSRKLTRQTDRWTCSVNIFPAVNFHPQAYRRPGVVGRSVKLLFESDSEEHGNNTKKQRNQKQTLTRMWANAQRDGRPAEYRCRHLFNAARKVWLTPTTRVPCSNAAKMRKPLTYAGVSQTPETISAVSWPKFAVLKPFIRIFSPDFRQRCALGHKGQWVTFLYPVTIKQAAVAGCNGS